MKPTEEQFVGSLIGQCVGDALGFFVEGCPPKYCKQFLREVVETGKIYEVQFGPFTFGQYTDDSQLARELLQSYTANDNFLPEDYAKRIAAIFEEERIVGKGQATLQAANRLIEGVSWEKSGTPPPRAGNGTAMRAGPVGLIYYNNEEKLLEVAHNQGWMTHQDSRCSGGSIAIAGSVALALQKKIQPGVFLPQLQEWVATVNKEIADLIGELDKWILLPPDEAVKFISRAGLPPDFEDAWVGISPFVVGSVLWSIYSFLRTPEDYKTTIWTAIEVGGDVDTTGAMAGAISGAYLGRKAIPDDFAHRLIDKGTWGYQQLVDLAKECYNKIHNQNYCK